MAAPLYETPRDRAICCFVYRYDGIDVSLLWRRFWPHSVAQKATYNRVSRLINHGYLVATRLPSLSGIGSGKFFLGLGPRGKTVVVAELGIALGDVHRLRPPRSPMFYAHHLGVCAVRLQVEFAVAQSPWCSLLGWTSERSYRDNPLVSAGAAGRLVTIVPDGGCVLQIQAGGTPRYLHCVLEYDTGSENAAAAVRGKVGQYLQLCSTAGFQHLVVLFVVPGMARLEVLHQAAIDEAQRLGVDPGRIWLTTTDQLFASPEAAMALPIWQLVGADAPCSLASFVRSSLSQGTLGHEPDPAETGTLFSQSPSTDAGQ